MIGNDEQTRNKIFGTIRQYCRDVEFCGMAPSPKEIEERSGKQPDLIFWDAKAKLAMEHIARDSFPQDMINVLLLDNPIPQSIGSKAKFESVSTFLYKPIQTPELLITLGNGKNLIEMRRTLMAQQKILEKIQARQNNPGIIGIPTEEGIEFLPATEIMRCEGMNKYTMILTTNSRKIVSSYNIGEFAKLLHIYGFYAPHKSHLINLRWIKRLTVENQIMLQDGSSVPLSRRRKCEFVQRFRGDAFH